MKGIIILINFVILCIYAYAYHFQYFFTPGKGEEVFVGLVGMVMAGITQVFICFGLAIGSLVFKQKDAGLGFLLSAFLVIGIGIIYAIFWFLIVSSYAIDQLPDTSN